MGYTDLYNESMEETRETPPQTLRLTVPMAIVIAGALIATGIFFSTQQESTRGGPAAVLSAPEEELPRRVRSVSPQDHIRGNPNARILIVEYSDTECPWCKRFHPTLQQLIETYGKEGQVAWVYRHFPLTDIHPKAAREAEATECAAELGGNIGFWEYLDSLFAVTPSNNNLDLALLPVIAEKVGLDRQAFEECLESGRHAPRVARDYQDGLAAGANGTPYSVILTKGGKTIPVAGAQPFAALKATIEDLLSNSPLP